MDGNGMVRMWPLVIFRQSLWKRDSWVDSHHLEVAGEPVFQLFFLNNMFTLN